MTETSIPEDPDRHVVANFNAVAATYDTLRFVQGCARRLVERVPFPLGAHVLDVATGTGWAALAAAQRVSPPGRVLGVDLAPELLEGARQKVVAAGLTHVEIQEGDAQRLPCGDQAFDVVLCASALFIIPDMLAALREWHRVLKPGGHVGFSGFGPTFRQPLADLWQARLRQYGVSLPMVALAQRLAEPETCRRLLHDAGFVHTEVQSEQLGYYFRTVEEYWDEVWSGPGRIAVLQLAPAQRAQLQAEYLAEVQGLVTDQGIWVDVPVHFAHGWKRSV